MLHVKGRIHGVHILLIQSLTKLLQRLTETLEVYNFTLTQELDHIIYIGII